MDRKHPSHQVKKTWAKDQITTIIFDRDGVLGALDFRQIIGQITPLLQGKLSFQQLSDHWDTFIAYYPFKKTITPAREAQLISLFWLLLTLYYRLPIKNYQALRSIDYTHILTPYPDTIIANQLKAQGYKIGVLTNFPFAQVDRTLEHLGVQADRALSSSNLGGVQKPAPRAYQAICEALEIDPQECLFIDDEPENVVGAQKYGLHALLLHRTDLDKTDPHIQAADYGIIHSLHEILPLLQDV